MLFRTCSVSPLGRKEIIVSLKKLPIDLSIVSSAVGAGAGTILVARGVRLQGAGASVPAGVEYKGNPAINGFRVNRDASDAVRSVTITTQVRRPGVLADGGKRSLMFPKFTFGADQADAAIASAKAWELVDIVANFSTTWNSEAKYIPLNVFEASPQQYQRALGTDGAALPNVVCVPVKNTEHSYAAQVLDWSKSDAAASDIVGQPAAEQAAAKGDQPF